MSDQDPIFPFDAQAVDAIQRAPADPEAAAAVLSLAAGYLWRREVMPTELARYIASALQIAAMKPAPYRANALAEELNLRVGNRRPAAVHSDEVLAFVEDPANGRTPRQRILKAAAHYKVSETTIRNKVKEERHYRGLKPYS